jgi:hypothetical protein
MTLIEDRVAGVSIKGASPVIKITILILKLLIVALQLIEELLK